MAINLSNYIKNLGKSVGYSAIEKIKAMNPATVSLIEANKDLTKDLYKNVKDYKSIVKNIPNAIRENEYYKIANTGFNNVLEDLRTGKLYNKERIEKTDLKLLGMDSDSLDSDFGDLDLDSNFDLDSDFDFDSIGDDDIFIANEMDEVGSKVANAISTSTLESANYLGEVNKASTKMLINQNNRLISHINSGMGAINTSIQELVRFQENVQTHIENSTVFYTTIGEKVDTTNKLLEEILELQKKNISSEEKNGSSSNTIKYSDIDDGMGGVDLKEYFKSIKKRLKSQSGGMFDMLSAFGNGNILETFVASPLSFITDNLVNKLIDDSIKNANANLDKSINGLFGSLMNRLNNMSNDYNNEILQKVGEIFGVNNSLKTKIDVSKYNKGSMLWNGKANKALTEVIPTQLSEIISILNGQSQKLFDYESGRFINRDSIEDSRKHELDREGINAASNVIDELRGMMEFISFENRKDKENLRKEIDSMFSAMIRDGSFLDIYDNEYTLPGVSNSEYQKYIKSMLKNVSRHKMLELNSRMMSSRDRYTKKMQDRESNGSIYSYLEDGFGSTHLSYTNKDGKKQIDASKDNSILSKLSIDRVKDNLGHNIFYYLQNINNELTYIRNNGGMGGGSSSGTAYYYPTGIVYKNNEFENTIVDDSDRSKNAKHELDKEIKDNIEYAKRREKELEKNPNLIKSEDIGSLEGIEFDRAISSAANSYHDKHNKNKYIPKVGTPKGIIDELLAAKSISEKSKVIVDNIKDISKQPSKLIASAMDSADRALYTIIYGDKRDKDGKRRSFFNELLDQMKFQFTKFNLWLDNTILEPVKEKLDIESFKDLPNKIFSMFGIDLNETSKNIKEYIFGASEIDANGNRVKTKDGLFTPIAKGISESFSDLGKFLDEAFDPIISSVKNKFKGTTVEENTTEYDEIPIIGTTSSSSVHRDSLLDRTNMNPKKNKKQEYNKKLQETDPSLVKGTNSYNLAGGYLKELDYKNIRSEIVRMNKINKDSEYKSRSIQTRLNALIIESEKYNIYSKLFSDILEDKKEGCRAAELLLRKVGSRDEDVMEMTLDEIYNELLNLGEFSVIRHGKNISGSFSSTYKGKQLISKFDKFADNAYLLDSNNISSSRSKSKMKDITKDISKVDLRNLDTYFTDNNSTRQSREEIGAQLESVFGNINRKQEELDIREAFSALDNVGLKNNNIIDELKSIHGTIKSILNNMRNTSSTTNIASLQTFSEGGILDYPEDTVIPTLLSGGEIVINPADKRTRLEQGKREKLVSKLFKNGKLNLMSDGGKVGSDGSITPLEEESEIEVKGKRYKYITVDGKKYIYTKMGFTSGNYHELSDFIKNGKYSSTRYMIDKESGKLQVVKEGKKPSQFGDNISRIEKPVYAEGEEPLAVRMAQTASSGLKDAANALGITSEDNKKFNNVVKDIMDNIAEYAPAATGSALIGSGVSLLTGAIGGPLLGAAAGAAIGLARKSSQVQSWLFGDKDEDGEYEGGFLSKELSNNIHKYLPGMAKSATVGGILSVLPFVPGGPIAGIMLGSAVGYAKNNEEFMTSIFGENYKENAGKFKDNLNKKLPNILLGTAGGALFGPLGGLLPNILLGSAVGFASSTEKFKSLLFGELQEDGTRDGGILNAVKVGIIDPIKDNGKELWDDIKGWVKNDIIKPIGKSIDPLFKQSTIIMNKVFNSIFGKLGDTLDNGISYVIENFVRTKILNPTFKRVRDIGGLLFNPSKKIISLPFRAVGAVGDHFRNKHISQGDATYMTAQERLDYRKDQLQKKNEGLLGRLGTKLNTTFGIYNNPISAFIRNRSAIKGDRFEDFDKFLTEAKDEELGQMKDNFKLLSDTDGYLKEEESKALVEQRKALYNNSLLDWNTANRIEEELNLGNYEKAKHLLDKADIDEFDRQKLINKIFSAGSRLNNVRHVVDNIKNGTNSAMDFLRHHKSGVFKGLKDVKDITKYQKYLDNEIANRKKTDVEIQTDQQKEHHTEIMNMFNTTISYLSAIATADPEKRAEKVKQLENRERAKMVKAVNTKAGLFGVGSERDRNARIFDIKTNEDGSIVTDEMGNPIYDYVGFGSMTHAERNMDLYETYTDENGETKLKLENGSPILKLNRRNKMTRANVFNTLHQSRYKKNELMSELMHKYAVEDIIKFNNSSSLKEKLNPYLRKYNIANVDLDRDVPDDINSNQIEQLLQNINFDNWKRKDKIKFGSSISNNNEEENGKDKWYMFSGTRRIKMTRDSDGNPMIDTQDPETSKNLEEEGMINKISRETRDAIVSFKDSTVGHLKRFLGFADYRDSDKETIWDKIKKVTGGVMGAWTLLSFAPYAKKFWIESAAPFLGKVLSPIAPTIERMSLKLDNFFMNTIPNTLKDVGNNIIWWLSGTGKYADGGLPSVFKDKIIPFYMGGLEFVIEDIVPTIFTHLPNLLSSVAKGAVKSLSNLLSTNIASLFRGEVPKLEDTKDDMKNSLDKGVFNKTTHKTGPFYTMYKNMFGGGSSSTSTPTTNSITLSQSTSMSSSKLSSSKDTEDSNVGNNINSTSNLSKFSVFSRNSDNDLIEQYVDNNSIYYVPDSEVQSMRNILSNDKYVNSNSSYSDLEAYNISNSNYSKSSAIDYSYILNNTSNGDAIMDSNGNLIYNIDGSLYNQDAYGNVKNITPVQATEENNYNENKSNNRSILESLTTRGTIGHATMRSFLTGNAGLATTIKNKIASNGDKLIKAKSIPGTIVSMPINSFSKFTSNIIDSAANTGRKLMKVFTEANSSTGASRVANKSVIKQLSELGNGTIIDNLTYGQISDNAMDEASKYLKLLGKTEDEIAEATTKIANKVSDTMLKNISEETGEVALKSSIKTKIASIFKSSKINTIMSFVFGDSAAKVLQQKLLTMSDELGGTLWKNIAKKSVVKSSQIIGKMTPASIAFAVLDFTKGYANAKANLGILREPTLVEKFISGAVTVINGYVTLGLVPEDFIYNCVITCLNAIGWATDLEQDRLKAKSEVARYNAIHGTDYTVSEYNTKDRTGISKFLLGGGEKQEETSPNKVMNYTLSSTYNSNDYSGIIGGSLSEAQLQYAKDNGLYASGSGIYSRGSSLGSSVRIPTLSNNSFISQIDPSIANIRFNTNSDTISQTVASSGCVPAVAAMMVSDMIHEPNSYSNMSNNITKAQYAINSKSDLLNNVGMYKTDINTPETNLLNSIGINENNTDYITKLNTQVNRLSNNRTNVSNNNIYLKDALESSQTEEYKQKNGGVKTKFIKDFMSKYGIDSTIYDNTALINWDNILKSGVSIAAVGKDSTNTSKKNSPFGPNSHAIRITGVSKDGKYVSVDDPEQMIPSVVYETNKLVKGIQKFIIPSKLIKRVSSNSISDTSSNLSENEQIVYNEYNDISIAIRYADLCSYSTISKSTFAKTVKKLLKGVSGSKFKKMSDIFLIASKETGFDPRFLLALALYNTEYGTNKFAKTYKNPYKIKNDKEELVKFKDIEDGIIEGAKYIKSNVYLKEGRYCLQQMAMNGRKDSRYGGISLLNLYKINIANVVAFMISKEMPENSKTVSYTAGPANSVNPKYDISGNKVFNKDDGTISSISDITNIFTKLANSIFGFSVKEDTYGLNDLVDGEDGLNSIKSNGHTYLCYCKECHPEMYDENGQPITLEAQAYSNALLYGGNINTNEVAKGIYDTLVKELEFGKNLDPISLATNPSLDYSKSPILADKMSKFTIMASEDSTIPGIHLAKNDNSGEVNKFIGQINKPLELSKDNIDIDLTTLLPNLHGYNLSLPEYDKYKPYRSAYEALRLYYRNRFGKDYSSNIDKNASESAYKKQIQYMRSSLLKEFSIPDNNNAETDLQLYSQLTEGANKLGYDSTYNYNNYSEYRRSILEPNKSYSDLRWDTGGKLKLYPVTKDGDSRPLYYLAEGNNLKNDAFKTNLLGIPVYGSNRVGEEGDPHGKSWKDVDIDEMINVYGLSKASNIVDQYANYLSVSEEDMTTDSADISLDNYQDISAQGSGLKVGSGSFVSQLDPRYSNLRFNTSNDTIRQTIGESGCAPAVATMAINNYIGKGTNMTEMSNIALDYKVKNGGTSSDYFEDVFARNGISSSYTENTSDIVNNLINGRSVVLLGKDSTNTSKQNSPFGPGNHYVLANGISDDGSMVYINDPELNIENVPYSSDILKNAELGISVGGSSKLMHKYSLFSGGGTYTKEVASIDELRTRNLGQFSEITVEQINKWINSRAKKGSNMYNAGKYFIKASNESGLDPRYLVAHAAIETGWGTSDICRMKYNFFGISAFDASPFASASKWGGIEEGIVKGAIWIATNYYAKGQTSLYTMRHNKGKHQYATDAEWDIKIAKTMKNGPINTNYSDTGQVISKVNATSTAISSTSSTTGDMSYSSISDMIGNVFGNLGTAIFGFESSSKNNEDTSSESTYETTGTTSNEVVLSSKDNKVRYILYDTNLYKYRGEPTSGAPDATKKILTRLSAGTKVSLISEDKVINVSRISVSGKIGYVKSNYLSKTYNSASASGSGVKNKSLYNSIYTGRGSKLSVPKSKFTGSGIEEILKPFNDFGKVFGFYTNSNTNDSTSDDSSTIVRSNYTKSYKDKFTLTNNTSKLGEKIVKVAKKELGKPYVWGATGPNSFDCSGLCKYVYAKCGINLKHRVSRDMASDSQGKVTNTASVGDLVFFGSTISSIHHVGIYIGDGQYIHAPKTGDVVKISKLSDRSDLIRIKHYTKSSNGSGSSILNKLDSLTNVESEPNVLDNYFESKQQSQGSGSTPIVSKSSVPVTDNTNRMEISNIDNNTLVQLLQLCCNYMSKTVDNTNSINQIVALLTKLVEKKSGSGSNTIKIESDKKAKNKQSSTNTVIINKDSSQYNDSSTQQLIDMLTKLASE